MTVVRGQCRPVARRVKLHFPADLPALVRRTSAVWPPHSGLNVWMILKSTQEVAKECNAHTPCRWMERLLDVEAEEGAVGVVAEFTNQVRPLELTP